MSTTIEKIKVSMYSTPSVPSHISSLNGGAFVGIKKQITTIPSPNLLAFYEHRGTCDNEASVRHSLVNVLILSAENKQYLPLLLRTLKEMRSFWLAIRLAMHVSCVVNSYAYVQYRYVCVQQCSPLNRQLADHSGASKPQIGCRQVTTSDHCYVSGFRVHFNTGVTLCTTST